MRIIRKFVAAASLTMLGAGGFALVAAGPASAAAGDSTLTCTPGTTGGGGFPIMRCTATDPDGVKTIHVVAKNSGGVNVGSASTPCSPTPATQLTDSFDNLQLIFGGSPPAPYQVKVVDCAGNTDIYRVDPVTGAATYIRSV